VRVAPPATRPGTPRAAPLRRAPPSGAELLRAQAHARRSSAHRARAPHLGSLLHGGQVALHQRREREDSAAARTHVSCLLVSAAWLAPC
jgi:hypothetical protein